MKRRVITITEAFDKAWEVVKATEDEVPIDPCSGCGLPHGSPGSKYCSEECERQGPYENR